MKKRILAFCLVLVMLFGMMPSIAMAETSAGDTNVVSVGYGSVTLDGSADETPWLVINQMSDGENTRAFGALWNEKNLYLAVEPSATDETLSVSVGGAAWELPLQTATLEDGVAVSVGASAAEIQIPFSAMVLPPQTVGEKLAVSLSMGGCSWDGNLTLDSYAHTAKGDYNVNGTQYYDGTTPDGSLGYEIAGDSATLWNEYVEGAANHKNGRVYAIDTGVTALADRTVDTVVEYDFTATDIPVHTGNVNIGTTYAAYGLTSTISDGSSRGIIYGFGQNADGLYFILTRIDKTVTWVPMEQKEGDTFHVRLVLTPEYALYVYINGELLTYIANAEHGGLSAVYQGTAKMLSFNLWSSGSSLTADGKYDTRFSVSNVRIGNGVSKKIYSSGNYVDAMLSPDAITTDGTADEAAWQQWHTFSGTPSGKLAAAWNKGMVYFAVASADADSVTVEVNGVSVTEELVSGNAEFAISMEDLGLNLTEYNQACSFSATLNSASGSTSLFSKPVALVFTGCVGTQVDMTAFSASTGFTKTANTLSFEGTQANTVNYSYTIKNGYSLDRATRLTQTLKFDSLPASDGAYVNNLRSNDYYFYASRDCYTESNTAATTHGYVFFCTVFNSGSGALTLRVQRNSATNYTDFALNRSVGDTFTLTTDWGMDDTLTIYVDGEKIGVAENVTYYVSGPGVDVLSFRYAHTTDSGAAVKFQVSDVSYSKGLYSTVVDEMTPANVLSGVDLTQVMKDLPMNETYSAMYLGEIPVRWSSSNPAVISTSGVVNRSVSSSTTADITLYLNDIALWTETATVLPGSVTEDPSPAIVTTAFAGDGVTVDGAITGEDWVMGSRILLDTGDRIGEMGALWDETSLYLAVETGSASQLAMTVNGKSLGLDLASGTKSGISYTYAKSGTMVEMKIALSDLGLSDASYRTLIPISVSLDTDATYEGSLKLSSVDWWAVENRTDTIPTGGAASVKYGAGTPTVNQGVMQLDNGWRAYDLYDPNGNNPNGVRTYIGFMTDTVFENFNDHSEAIYVEFDFEAKSLPVYDITNSTDFHSAFSNYGATWSLGDKQDADKFANVIVGGILNTADGLQMVVQGAQTDHFPLNKQVGDTFRVGLVWHSNGDYVVYIDGEQVAHYKSMQYRVASVANSSFMFNTVRHVEFNAASEADSIDVYYTNIAFGKLYSEGGMTQLTFDDIRGENTAENNITSDLVLPDSLNNNQLSTNTPLYWTSANPDVIDPETGKITRPENGAVTVDLTAYQDNGDSKVFRLTVIGVNNDNTGKLVVTTDWHPNTGSGVSTTDVMFTLDTDNNSVILDQGSAKKFNVVKLTDMDEFARLNRESMTLWVSDDNANYTEVDSYKLLHSGTNWYLYDFEATARYIKVHYTHFDGTDADFTSTLSTMIDAYAEDIFGANGGEFTETVVTVTNDTRTKWQDKAVTLTGVTGDSSVRVYMDGELLYHYVDNGSIIVRIPDLARGASADLIVLTGNENALDISNKENVYEVTYGTRETRIDDYGRWIISLKAGAPTPSGTPIEKDMLLSLSWEGEEGSELLYSKRSYDGGYTWGDLIQVPTTLSSQLEGDGICGGYIYDSVTGRIFYETHEYQGFSSTDMNASYCVNKVIYSDDGGKTWAMADILEPDTIDGVTYNYMLSYSDGIMVSSYDGSGPNVDFLFNSGCQYNTNGAFCGRVAYSCDGGFTWQYSKSLLVFGNELAFEGGISECSILENEAGTLVLYARCQSTGVDNFAKFYSYDKGITWTSPADTNTSDNKVFGMSSTVYTVNTQPVMMKWDFDQDGVKEAPLLIWGGNNVQGGNSYIRNPLNIAISYDGLENFRNIQNLFAETFMEVYTQAASHYITNPSAQQFDDDMVVTFGRLRHGNSVQMIVSDFDNWFYRTKGIYDSFEHGTVQYEGWITTSGSATLSDACSTDGDYSMKLISNTNVTRSVPYLQDGTVEMDLYVAGGNFSVELQSAYSSTYAKASPVGFQVTGHDISFLGSDDATGLSLKTGWNTVKIDLDLPNGTATMSVNGGEAVAMPVNLDIGDYVCYLTFTSSTQVFVDEVLVESHKDTIVFTEEIKETELAEFYGVNMKLSNDLSMNFFIKSEAVANAEFAEITYMGETAVYEKDQWVVEGSYFKITFAGMSAKEMTEEITIQLFDAEGNAVSEAYTDSIRNYATRILNRADAKATDKTLMVDMLNYGAAAQTQFTYKTDDLANANLTDEQKAYATESVELSDNRVKGENYYGSSLNLKTNIQLNIYFRNVTADMTATVSYTNHNGEAKSFDVPIVMSGSYGKVTVESMVVADVYELLTVEVKDADGNVVARGADSVESYCYRTMADQPLNEYLMKFAQSAWKSFHS